MAPPRDDRSRPHDDSLRWAFGAMVETAVDHAGPVDVDDFQELRRQGLFADDGRNPPPSWWTR